MNTEQFDGHTPGPWTLEEMEDDEGQQWFEVPAVHYTTKQSGDGSQQEYADAQLIAAAPDLLAEVKRLRDVVDFAIVVLECNGEKSQADMLKRLRGEEE